MSKLKTLKGIIIPSGWDKLNNVMCITLSTIGEKDYPIFMDDLGRTLLNYIRSQVELEGTLTQNKKSRIFKVDCYKIIKQY